MSVSYRARPRTGTGSTPSVSSVFSTAALLVLGLAGCEAAGTAPLYDDQPAGIQLSIASADLDRGDTTRVRAVLLNGSGSPIVSPSAGAARTHAPLTWTSSDPSVATISRSGLLLAQRDGEVTVTASSGSLLSSSTVQVQARGKRVTIAPKVDTLHAAGHTLQLSVTVLNPGGREVSNPSVEWTSLQPGVAEVDGNGLVRGVAAGTASITAVAQGQVDTAQIVVRQGETPPPPAVAVVEVSPGTATAAVGSTARFTATVRDGSGKPMAGVRVVWSSSDPTVASVDAQGLATARSAGDAVIRATADGISGAARLAVAPASGGEWDRVLSDVTIEGDLVVPDGEKWLIGANVQVRGNVRTVNGTVAMRAGSTLRLLGGNPEEYVGGGMHFHPGFARDIGIWIGGHGARGRLDISCTPKTGWNRTGVDPTWHPQDEYWIAPTAVGDLTPRRWYPGQPIPRIDPRVPAAEVINVTRDCSIEGPGHIHIHSTVPQTIEYVTLRRMGIVRPNDGGSGVTTGRYALHLHHGGDGMRGTVVRGVASIDAGGRVFVPHASHGIRFIDNVAVNSWADAFWWDNDTPEDASHDIEVDRLAVAGVHLPRDWTGSTSQVDGISLRHGDRNTMRNSVVSGVRGSKISNGFNWNSAARVSTDHVWTFDAGNVAHNNQGSGLRFWNNIVIPHETFDVVTYRNAHAGIENGAYANANFFDRLVLVEDVLFAQASGRTLDGRPQTFRNVTAPTLMIGHIRLEATAGQHFENCDFERVIFNGNQRQSWHARFVRCNVVPEMIEWPSPMPAELEGSSVQIEHRDGRRWRKEVRGGRVETTRI
jgi:uncharacterized protein YjdB